MEYRHFFAAQYAGTKLDSLINRAHRDTLELVEKDDIPLLVKHLPLCALSIVRSRTRSRSWRTRSTIFHYNLIPTMFDART